jgi:chromosome segregation ATPase
MADKTFGVKVSEEMYEKAKMVIESSGVSTKEWFEKAVALYEINAIKQGSSDYTQDLTELEHHTTRIYELIANMIQRSVYLKDHAVKDISDKLDLKESMISDFQMQFLQFKEEITAKDKALLALQEQEHELKEKLKANETTLENNQALIAEYKEKNDRTLSGLVAKYQAFAEENEQLKATFAEEKKALVTSAASEKQLLEEALATASNEAKAHEAKAAELEKVLVDEKTKSEQATALLQERHELALERATVKAEREYQEKLQAQLDTYNARIQELQAENDRIRGTYETRLEELLKNKE